MDTVSKQLAAYGTAAYECGHYTDAIRCFNDLVQYDPDDWRSRMFLTMCLIQTRDFSHARHELTFVMDHCPVESYREKAYLQLRNVIYAEQNSVPAMMAPTPEWLHNSSA
jgi:cytochrome c-type biogenesis protein CcmH/NrfG